MMKEWTGGNTGEFFVMTRQQVRDFDAWAIHSMKIPGVVLMENAAGNCSELIFQMLAEHPDPKVCIFCGGGNNGGDGFVIARHLFNRGVSVKIVICADPAKIKGDAKVNFDICQNMNLSIHAIDIESVDMCKEIEGCIEGYDLLVDAILGTGMSGELKSSMALLISCINSYNLPTVAIDIPSGLDCDTGLPLPVCIKAKATVTFVAIKKGFFVCRQSALVTGRVFVADIGITSNPQTAQ